MKKYSLVTIVVITYKRVFLLKQMIESFRKACTYPNLEFILCDDGSDKHIQKEMKKLPFDTFLFGNENCGLGYNTNKGLKEAKGEYIFQIQDDWVVKDEFFERKEDDKNFIEVAIEMFNKKKDVQFLRYTTTKREYKAYKEADVFMIDDRFKAKIYKYNKVGKGYLYSDRPHIKKRSFHRNIGFYKEFVSVPNTERDMGRKFQEQEKVKMGQLEDFFIFRHIGREHSLRDDDKKRDEINKRMLCYG